MIAMQEVSQQRAAKFGLTGFLLGIASLVVLVIQLSAFFEPQEKSAGTTIGEIAAEIRLSATRALSGEPAPAPIPPRQNYSLFITIGALCLAGVAVVLGGIGLYRNEPHRLSYLAVGVGTSALVMHFVFWLAVLICGVALLISIIGNIDGILDG